MTTTRERPTQSDDLPDLDAEREVDLRGYWNTLASRWWLPAAGLAIGIVVGLLVSVGGNQVYTAKTSVYLGQPLSPGGSFQLQSVATNPSTVGTIIHSEAALRRAARAAGMPVAKLRGHVTSRAVAGSLTKLGQTPLVLISVTSPRPRQAQVAANTLAKLVIQQTSTYVNTLIQSLESQIGGYTQSLNAIDSSLKSSGLSGTDKLVASIQRAQIVDQLTTAKQQLAVAKEVELGRQVTFARAAKTTARSRRNTVIVAALIGLLIGIFAALLWEPVGRIVRKPA